MDKKELKKTQAVTANKTKKKRKKTSVRKKEVAVSTTIKEKKKPAKKTDRKEIIKAKVKSKAESKEEKPVLKEERAAEQVKVKWEQKAENKKTTKKAKKKLISHPGNTVKTKQGTVKPQKKITHREISVLEKTAWTWKKGLPLQKVGRYPSLPVEKLPEEYGEDSIALMTVDPRKLFVYWETTKDTFKKHKGILNIRLYDVMGIEFDGTNSRSYSDVVINRGIGNLYLAVNPEKEFIADIGIIDSLGTFSVVARSNRVSTPRAEVMEKGILPERLYETGFEMYPPFGYKK